MSDVNIDKGSPCVNLFTIQEIRGALQYKYKLVMINVKKKTGALRQQNTYMQ